VAKKRLPMRIPPTFPTLYESVKGENQSRQDRHPKYYARSTKHRPDTGRSGTRRSRPDRRCRGCGSTEHLIRDGKCDARDVAAYLRQRLISAENPHKILHDLCFVGDGQDADPHATALQENCDNSFPPVGSGDGSESEPSLSYLVSKRPNADAEHGFKAHYKELLANAVAGRILNTIRTKDF
jgi:hypothetical protein